MTSFISAMGLSVPVIAWAAISCIACLIAVVVDTVNAWLAHLSREIHKMLQDYSTLRTFGFYDSAKFVDVALDDNRGVVVVRVLYKHRLAAVTYTINPGKWIEISTQQERAWGMLRQVRSLWVLRNLLDSTAMHITQASTAPSKAIQ